MSRSLGVRKNEGLDLLLDTICNAFGSIIFIALLVVVISADHSEDSTDAIHRPLDRDEVQRQIRTAEADIEKLQQAVTSPSSDQKLAQSVASLEAKLSAAKAALEKARKSVSENRENATWDYSAAAAESTEESRRLSEEISRLQNEIRTSDARIVELQKYATSLQASIDKEIDNRTEQVRLPREHTTNKDPFPLIFIYNEIYPLFAGGHWEPTQGIESIEIDSTTTRYNPLRGHGLKPLDLEKIIASFPLDAQSERYFPCYVFADSIEAFREFRKYVQQKNFDIGWQPQTDPSLLLFSTEGTSPDPQ